MDLVYKKETLLFGVLATISIIFWLILIVGTFGIALIYILLFFVFYLFAQSAFISYLKGTAVKITPEQFPDLHQRITACCERLKMNQVPDAYLLHADGAFNAFATRFLGRNFIALYSDVVDALEQHPDAVNFYIGHELGHIHRKHLNWGPVLVPAGVLPLLGAAYSRACEYTCDRYGYACCENPQDAQYGLAALAAGAKRWRTLDTKHYASQSVSNHGFWMSFHELIGDYPWLVKRMAVLNALATNQQPHHPLRNPFAWILALFVPRIGIGGASGGMASMLIVVAIIGILAAIAIPSYQDYVHKAQVMGSLGQAQSFQQAVLAYASEQRSWPNSNADVGLPPSSPTYGKHIQAITVSEGGIIRVGYAGGALQGKSLTLSPYIDNGELHWKCASADVPLRYMPADCQ